MLIFGDTPINMKTENRWKKKFMHSPKAKKKSYPDKIAQPPPLKNKIVHPLRQEI